MTPLIAMPEPALPPSGAADAAHPADLPALPGLSRLLHHARRLPDAQDWRSGVLEALHPGAAQWPAAAVAACALPRLAVGTAVCMVAPLHVVAGISRVHLPPGGRLILEPHQSEAWREAFNREFGAADLQLHAVGAGWLLEAPFAHAAADPSPETLAGGALAREPARDEALRSLRRLGAEVEMWLASHAMHGSDERRQAPALNSFWFWGGARTGLPVLSRRAARIESVVAADAWLTGLAAHSTAAVTVTDRPDATQDGVLTVLAPAGDVDPARFWPRVDAWVSPAAEALASGTLGALRLQIGASTWELPDRSPLRWLRRQRPWWQRVAA